MRQKLLQTCFQGVAGFDWWIAQSGLQSSMVDWIVIDNPFSKLDFGFSIQIQKNQNFYKTYHNRATTPSLFSNKNIKKHLPPISSTFYERVLFTKVHAKPDSKQRKSCWK